MATEPEDKSKSSEEQKPIKMDDSALPLNKRVLFEIDQIANEIVKLRGRPLLLMFYSHTAGKIMPADLNYLEEGVFGDVEKLAGLDLILHTRGGDVSSSYRIAQLIRSKCLNLNALIPIYSYSGGTVISLAADEILMNRGTSLISPIDVQLNNDKESMSLLNFDKFIEFLKETSNYFEFEDDDQRAKFISALMEKLVERIDPLQIGEFYRLRGLQSFYAKTLLTEYMFRNDSDKERIANDIVTQLTSKCPTHDFDIDFQIALDIGLKVGELEKKTYKLGKQLINKCVLAKRMGIVCDYIDSKHNWRMPFFKLYGVTTSATGEDNEKK
ncbi:MAG: hypothetical protein AABX01_00970 [Candidatus Micrarchaeota archaeon]